MPGREHSAGPIWLYASAVVWVATRDAALADSLAGKRGTWWRLARTAVAGKLSDMPLAPVAAHDASPAASTADTSAAGKTLDQAADAQTLAAHEALKKALIANALKARSAADGRGAVIAAVAWAAPITNDDIHGALVGATTQRAWDPHMFPVSPRRRAAGAQPAGGWRTTHTGGVVPLFRAEDVMRVFPPSGTAVDAAPARAEKERNMTGTVIGIAKRRKREGRSLIRVAAGKRAGVAKEMQAIQAELPPGMRPSPSTFKKVITEVHPTR
jgi:hypothetical protein